MERARGWVFTLNNYNDTNLEYFNHPSFMSNFNVRYMVIGKEVAESGTPHLQGYIEFINAISFDGCRKILVQCHIEKRRGKPSQAEEYCKKDGNFVEYGKPLKQGERTDLNAIANLVMEGKSLDSIAEEVPSEFIKFNRGITALHTNLQKHRDRNIAPTVEWYYGPTGAGKTKKAVEKCETFYIKDETKWWDGYDQQEAIIIDDFDGKWPFRNLLRLLDRYPYQAEIKGGTVKINSPFILITCEFPPDMIWQGTQLAQIKRRISKIEKLNFVSTEVGTEVEGNSSLHLQPIEP